MNNCHITLVQQHITSLNQITNNIEFEALYGDDRNIITLHDEAAVIMRTLSEMGYNGMMVTTMCAVDYTPLAD
jgi:hypothetical protein